MDRNDLLSSVSLGNSGVIDAMWVGGWKHPKIDESCFHGYSSQSSVDLPKNSVVMCFIHNFADVVDNIRGHPNRNFIIICREGDPILPTHIVNGMPNNIKHVFSINVTENNSRVTPMPMAFHIGTYCLDSTVRFLNSKRPETINEVLVTFSTEGYKNYPNHERNQCLNYFRDKSWATIPQQLKNGEWVTSPMNYLDYIPSVMQHRYLAAPVGNGFERIAYWEAMLFGTIPICLKHPALLHFEDMPIAFVDSWQQVTPEWCEQNKNIIEKPIDKIMIKYWVNQINEAKSRYFS